MPIQLPQGLQINAKQAVDTRILLSKEAMLTINDNVMPVKYFTICVDDGKIYLYDKANEMDAETGKFREALAGVNGDIEDLKQQLININNTLNKKQDKLTAGKSISIEQDSEGNLVISAIIDVEELADQLPGALKMTLQKQAEKGVQSGIIVDSEGNIKVNLNSDDLEIVDNKIQLAFTVIQSE